MSSFRIRPRFEHQISCSPQELQKRLQHQIVVNNTACLLRIKQDQIYLLIPNEEQHFWSPQLQLQLDKDEQGNQIVRGLYGPNPNVWILFIYGYAALGILATFSLIIGFSQWSLAQSPWGLWVFSLLAFLALGLYLIAQTGQKLGAAQTFRLHHCYEEAVDGQIIIH
ncbi:MAG: hypothetical protein AAFN10_10975 [Bacteroidota bacterium]